MEPWNRIVEIDVMMKNIRIRVIIFSGMKYICYFVFFLAKYLLFYFSTAYLMFDKFLSKKIFDAKGEKGIS